METRGKDLSTERITVSPFSNVKDENGNDGSSSGCAEAEEMAKKRKRENPTTIILLSFMSIVFCPLQSVFGEGDLNESEESANSFDHNYCLIIHLFCTDGEFFQFLVDFVQKSLSSNF